MDDINWTGQETPEYKELVHTLLDVTRIFSPSTMEGEMVVYCDTTLRACGFDTHVDQIGNITAVRGNFPKYICLNAHMDVVLSAIPHKMVRQSKVEALSAKLKPEYTALNAEMEAIAKKGRKLKEKSPEYKELLALYHSIADKRDNIKKQVELLEREYPPIPILKEGYWRPNEIRYFPKSGNINHTKGNKDLYIGGDDKCGVAIILTLAKLTHHPFKVVLSVREEPPFHGSTNGVSAVDPAFFSDVIASITIDKRGNDALVDRIGGVHLCNKSLIQTIKDIGETCGIKYRVQEGYTCDADKIYKYCPAVNMSCGYYDPHSQGDYIKVPETYQTMCVVEKIIGNHNSML